MATPHLRKLEILVVVAICVWLGEVFADVLAGLMGGYDLGSLAIRHVMVSPETVELSVAPVKTAAFLQGAINGIFFCAVMWQIKILLAHARSERHLLRGLGTLLPRIGWLILSWPAVAWVVPNIGHVTTMIRESRLSWECSYPFTHVSFMFVGVVLLVLGSTVDRLRRAYDEMQLVV